MFARRIRRTVTTDSVSLPTYPAELLDLTSWKLTLPINNSDGLGNGSGSPREITQPTLDTYKHDDYFYVDNSSGGIGVNFVAPCNGATTSGSSYPRSELREMISDGSDEASWGVNDGDTHTLIITQSIDSLPVAKPQVACGQIHDAENDVIEILADGFSPVSGTTATTGQSTAIPFVIGYRYDDDEQPEPIIPSYTMGQKFTVRIVVASNQIQIYADIGTAATTLRATKSNVTGTPLYSGDANANCYFKAGSYTQSNTTNAGKNVPSGTTSGGGNLTNPQAGQPTGGDSASAYGQVTIYALTLTHA